MDSSRVTKTGVLVVLLGASFLAPAGAVPPGFNIQGRLTDANGLNREGNYSLRFTLYDAATSGTTLWSRTYSGLPVRNGNFQTFLGDVVGQPLLSDVFAAGDSRHLEISVLSGPGVPSPEPPLVPRQKLVSVPYALKAASAGGIVSDGPAVFTVAGAEAMRTLANGNTGIGTPTPGQKLSVAGTVESTSGGFKFPDGSVLTTAVAAPMSGSVVQTRHAQTNAYINASGAVLADGAVPQITAGMQVLTVTITPKSTQNLLFVETTVNMASGRPVALAIFKSPASGNLLSAVAHVFASGFSMPVVSGAQMVAGTTNPITFSVRVGNDVASTLEVNGRNGAAAFGGSAVSFLRVTESVP